MRPIPKTILIHNATIKTPTGKDRWGAETFTEPVPMKCIRIDPSSKRVQNKDTQELQLKALLFYDCKNSTPRELTFAQGQVITFGGVDFIVQTIEPLYDHNKLHHYEIGVM